MKKKCRYRLKYEKSTAIWEKINDFEIVFFYI